MSESPSSGPAQCTFTIFTAAFNRPETLRRVYESLAAQTFRDFEWVIVDDGSGPEVRAAVEELQAGATFPIVYIRQRNQGKHAAHNRAAAAAHGRYFAPLDDDDTCMPNALERMLHHWSLIPAVQRDEYVAVMGLCVDQNGKVLGDRFPTDVFDSDYITYFYQQRIPGERWGSYRTEVLRAYPYPVAEGPSAYMIEGVTWFRMARRYKTRYVNEVWRTWYLGHYSVSSRQARKHVDYRRIGPTQTIVYGQQLNEMVDQLPYRPRFLWMSAAHFSRFAFHAGYPLPVQWRMIQSRRGRLLWLSALPLGAAYWVRDRLLTWRRTRRDRAAPPSTP